jgi:hypothetical protein
VGGLFEELIVNWGLRQEKSVEVKLFLKKKWNWRVIQVAKLIFLELVMKFF